MAGVRDFRELVCWKLCHELKCEVFEFTATGPASRDFEYRDQIRDSSSSSHRNISEGFGRFRPGEFARFLEYSLASLLETQDALIDGKERGYVNDTLFSRLFNLSAAAVTLTKRLMMAKRRQADRERRARRHREPSRRQPLG